MLMIINDICPYIGLFLCLFAWRLERFNTKPLAIQLTLIIKIVMWVFLYFAGKNPAFNPTFGSVAARVLIICSTLSTVTYVYIVTKHIRCLKTKTCLCKEDL